MTGAARAISFRAGPEDAGRRLDQVLAARAPGLSRRAARVLIDIGGVFVDGVRAKQAGRAVRDGQTIAAHVGGAFERATKRVGRAARESDQDRLPAYAIVQEDADVIVVEKPAGLLTAPTPESDRQNLADLLGRRPGGNGRVFVVHRLDLDTSGLLVFAKTETANRILAERFRRHDLTREYLAVVAGVFPDGRARIDDAIAGRSAATRIALEERLGPRATVLRCTLETGRTHQIRVHLARAGHPVLGDRRYGRATAFDPPRAALHATRLALPHPCGGPPIDVSRPWPADLAAWLTWLRGDDGATT